MLDTHRSLATTYCEDIDGNTMVIGEFRYYVFFWGTDVAYANAYWDNGAELALDENIGGASSTAADLRFYGMSNATDDADVAADCATITFEQTLQYSSTQSAGCPSGYSVATDTMVVDTCESGIDSVWAGKLVGRAGLAYRKYWNSELTVTGDESSATDSACFTVLTGTTDCTLTNF